MWLGKHSLEPGIFDLLAAHLDIFTVFFGIVSILTAWLR